MAQLTSLRLAGWKSIRDAKVEFRPLNVLIGANGAGKSNLVSFFKLMNEMMDRRLQDPRRNDWGGRIASPLRFEADAGVSKQSFDIATDPGQREYSFRLVPVAG